MTHSAKLLGHCTQCNTQCYDPQAFPPQPKSAWLGVRAHFMLSDGSLMPITMCDACAAAPDYEKLWDVVMAGWLHETVRGDEDPIIRDNYVLTQFARGTFILELLYTEPWTEVGP